MKKIYFLIAIFVLAPLNNANAQLEVIDKVAEVLIPGITKGIKSVLESSNGKKVKKTEVKKMKKELIGKTKKIIESLDDDILNVSAINELFSITGTLHDDIGVLKAITHDRFLKSIIKSQSESLYKETAIMFSFRWNQIVNKKEKLKSISQNAASGSVADDIGIYIANIEQALIVLESTVGLSKNPSPSMNYKEVELYVTNIDRAKGAIGTIDLAVNNINVQLSKRINSFKKSLDKAKKKIEDFVDNEE